MCDGTNHNLIRIQTCRGMAHETVVRWCQDCGAVVVDIDYDGRTQPGAVMKMRFPTGKREPQDV